MRRETQQTNKTVVAVVEIGSPFFSEALMGNFTPKPLYFNKYVPKIVDRGQFFYIKQEK